MNENKNDYCKELNQKKEIEFRLGPHEIMHPLMGYLSRILSAELKAEEAQEQPTLNIEDHSWYESLCQYKNQIVVYLFSIEQLHRLTPLLQQLNEPIILLSECELSDDVDLPENVTVLYLDFSIEKVFLNRIIEHRFPLVFHYTNTFDILLRILEPRQVMCIEQHLFQEQLLESITRSYHIVFYKVQ